MQRSDTSAESAARFLAMRGAGRGQRKRRPLSPVRVPPAVTVPQVPLITGQIAIINRVRVECLRLATSASARRVPNVEPLPPWPTMPFESNADRLRRYRLAAVARGLCYTCRKRPQRSGWRYCDECIARSDAYVESIKYKRCLQCGAKVSKTQCCKSCTAKNSEHDRTRRLSLIAAGMCARCGKREHVTNATMCQECLDDVRDRVLLIERRRGRKPKPCGVCRELGIDGTGHNRRSHDRWMERRKAWLP